MSPPVPRPTGVERLLREKRVCVCAGSGGVGKTTTAAAVAMGMAAHGRRVAVLTIDPAPRLAGSLGLEELGGEPRRVDPARLADAGVDMRGELWAMALDPKRTFDDLVERYAPDPVSRDRILANRIYQEISNAVAGSQEYMAMEKLYELDRERDYDLLVLDTPPTRNALDFLDAPERLSRFLDSRALGFFMRPGRAGLRLFERGTGIVFSLLKRVTGAELMQDLAEFFQSLGDMPKGFRQRAEQVNQLLTDPRTAFLLVTSPHRDSIDESVLFRRRLADAGIPFAGVVVNRVTEGIRSSDGREARRGLGPAGRRRLSERLGEELAARVAQTLDDWRRLAVRDADGVARLQRELGGAPTILVPHLERDVHDLVGLASVNRHLFGGAGSRRHGAAGGGLAVAHTGAE